MCRDVRRVAARRIVNLALDNKTVLIMKKQGTGSDFNLRWLDTLIHCSCNHWPQEVSKAQE